MNTFSNYSTHTAKTLQALPIELPDHLSFTATQSSSSKAEVSCTAVAY